MKTTERDALLARLDERTNNIWHLTEKQEEHLTKINDALLNHAVKIATNRASIKWIIRILSASGLLGGSVAGILKLFGAY